MKRGQYLNTEGIIKDVENQKGNIKRIGLLNIVNLYMSVNL